MAVDGDPLASKHELALHVPQLIEMGIVHRGRLARRETLWGMDAPMLELDAELPLDIVIRNVVVHQRRQHLHAEPALRKDDIPKVRRFRHRRIGDVLVVGEPARIGAARIPGEDAPGHLVPVRVIAGVEPAADSPLGHIPAPPGRLDPERVIGAGRVVRVVFRGEGSVLANAHARLSALVDHSLDDALVVPGGIAPQDLVALRPAQEEMDIVLPGKTYAAMNLQRFAGHVCGRVTDV